MNRLSDRAYRILHRELHRKPAETASDRVCRKLLQERLEKLRDSSGTPLTEAELQQVISGFDANFNRQVIQKAAKANRPSGIWGVVKLGTVALLGSAGLVYVANLPYPMIREPIADEAPLLLLPSFLEMDYNYRRAIALVEQADQLVNQATSAADFQLGGEKVTQAQKHLDKLPVWFLGYYPEGYCTLFGCSWRFTYDEFKVARQQVARMEAKLFQEENAQTQFNAALSQLNTARQKQGQAQNAEETQGAIVLWQAAIDELNRIPTETLAGRAAQTETETASRDLQAITGTVANQGRTNNYLEAAKAFGFQAATLSQNPPHNLATWKQITELWQDAVFRLDSIGSEDSGYVEAQTKLAEYKTNLAQAKIRLENERESVAALERAKEMTSRWQAIAVEQPQSRRIISLLQDILNELDKVQPGTTATAEAEQLSQSARNALNQLREPR